MYIETKRQRFGARQGERRQFGVRWRCHRYPLFLIGSQESSWLYWRTETRPSVIFSSISTRELLNWRRYVWCTYYYSQQFRCTWVFIQCIVYSCHTSGVFSYSFTICSCTNQVYSKSINIHYCSLQFHDTVYLHIKHRVCFFGPAMIYIVTRSLLGKQSNVAFSFYI